MQLWRLLMDCNLHHHGTALYDIDYIIRELTKIDVLALYEYSLHHIMQTRMPHPVMSTTPTTPFS